MQRRIGLATDTVSSAPPPRRDHHATTVADYRTAVSAATARPTEETRTGPARERLVAEGAVTHGAWLAGSRSLRGAVRVRPLVAGAQAAYDFYPERAMLEAEFDHIWATQARFPRLHVMPTQRRLCRCGVLPAPLAAGEPGALHLWHAHHMGVSGAGARLTPDRRHPSLRPRPPSRGPPDAAVTPDPEQFRPHHPERFICASQSLRRSSRWLSRSATIVQTAPERR